MSRVNNDENVQWEAKVILFSSIFKTSLIVKIARQLIDSLSRQLIDSLSSLAHKCEDKREVM